MVEVDRQVDAAGEVRRDELLRIEDEDAAVAGGDLATRRKLDPFRRPGGAVLAGRHLDGECNPAGGEAGGKLAFAKGEARGHDADHGGRAKRKGP